MALVILERFEEAETAFRSLLAADQNNPHARLGLMRALAALEKTTELANQAEKLDALQPSEENQALIELLKSN